MCTGKDTWPAFRVPVTTKEVLLCDLCLLVSESAQLLAHTNTQVSQVLITWSRRKHPFFALLRLHNPGIKGGGLLHIN